MSLRLYSDETARTNQSTAASFRYSDVLKPFGEGGYHLAARGRYTEGGRNGETCVAKWSKEDGMTGDSTCFDEDVKTVYQALEVIHRWNQSGFFPKTVKINVPEVWTYGGSSEKEVWTFDGSSKKGRAGVKCMIEPFIRNYNKYNCSSNGWCKTETPCARAMQALSHFSYHISGGYFVLCDLQGGEYAHAVVLTDPVILSLGGTFGATDLGKKGISNFFGRHVCNEFCNPSWSKPSDQTLYEF